LLEPYGQPVAIGTILSPSRQFNHLSDDPLQPEFEKWSIMDFEQPVRDMDAEIRVDPDQVSIERRIVSGSPFETIGCPSCSSASMTM
jgi:hypothetical protein